MKPFAQFPRNYKKNIRYVLTDIDDTLSIKGRIPSASFTAMAQLQKAGIRVIPITGRPAGWCDHMARMWPVDGLVGENGAFYFRYDESNKKMIRRYYKTEKQRSNDRKKLEKIKQEILQKVPGCRVSADQAYREADLAIDFCEDVPSIPMEDVEKIVRCFKRAGAQAKISSIHVNGWFGDYDKLTMTHLFFKEVFRSDLDKIKEHVVFTGDSPNDVPMFDYFPHSVGVANIVRFKKTIDHKPAWVTENEGGYGFAEMVKTLLS
ncbi:MAG: HAD family phosphatase [Deltaproteobacteria bacterium]|jgi:HAD superfamily hydrolase (TIGR01484 family)|nr:HAD family phosphatase [Deltaproteobacteria bacterium]